MSFLKRQMKLKVPVDEAVEYLKTFIVSHDLEGTIWNDENDKLRINIRPKKEVVKDELPEMPKGIDRDRLCFG